MNVRRTLGAVAISVCCSSCAEEEDPYEDLRAQGQYCQEQTLLCIEQAYDGIDIHHQDNDGCDLFFASRSNNEDTWAWNNLARCAHESCVDYSPQDHPESDWAGPIECARELLAGAYNDRLHCSQQQTVCSELRDL